LTETLLHADFDRDLNAALREDRLRVEPRDDPPEAPGEIVFFDEAAWDRVLGDLGYGPTGQSPFHAALAGFVSEARRDPALAAFRAAVEALGGIASRHGPASTDDLFAVDALLEVLRALVSLQPDPDGTHPAADRPFAGEVTVWSRIVQSRLDRLGLLLHTGVGHPWSAEEDLALMRLDRLLAAPGATLGGGGEPDLDALVSLSGDVDAMISRLRARDPGGFLVARSAAFPGNRDAFYERLRINTEGFFSTAPLIRFAPALAWSTREDGRPEGRIAQPLHDSAEAALADPANRLGLRLVQIKLWHAGFYGDRIDAIVGPNTISAILESAEIFGRQTLGEVVPDILRRLGEGEIAINLHGLDALVFSAEMRAVPEEQEAGDLLISTASDIVLERATEDALAARDPERAAPPLRPDVRAGTGGLLARLKREGSRLLRSVGQVFRSVSAAIRRGLNNMAMAVDRMLTPVRDVLTLAFEQIERARSLVFWALRSWRTFVFGEPVAVGADGRGFVTARFSIDRDARLLFINAPDADVIAAFDDSLDRLFRVMRLSLNAGVTVINLMRAVATWRGRIRLVLELSTLLRARLVA